MSCAVERIACGENFVYGILQPIVGVGEYLDTRRYVCEAFQ